MAISRFFCFERRLPALHRRDVAVGGVVVVEQVVGGHAEETADFHHVFRVRHGAAALPLADGLAGDGDALGQLFLAPAPGLPQGLEFLSKGHIGSASLFGMVPV